MRTLIINAWVMSHSTNGYYNILIEGQLIKKLTTDLPKADVIIDATSLVAIPGLIDIHTHLREPGYEYKETIESGLKAAAHGGVTTLGIMPNTNPPVDNLRIINFIESKVKKANLSKAIIIPALTKKREGKELNDIESLIKKGYRIFSDDGDPVYNSKIMYDALNILKKYNGVVINHCEDKRFKDSDLYESLMVARDIELSKYTGAHVHIAHISKSSTIDLIKYAKSNDINITCEVTFHHLLLNNPERNPMKKINPPLPDPETQRKLIENIDYIDIIVSDHAPHSFEDKGSSYEEAANGIAGLDLFFPAIYTVSKKYNIDLKTIVEKVTYKPASIFNLKNVGDIKVGYQADIVLVDLNKSWDKMVFSKGKNIPYDKLYGRVVLTMVDGEIKYDGREF